MRQSNWHEVPGGRYAALKLAAPWLVGVMCLTIAMARGGSPRDGSIRSVQ